MIINPLYTEEARLDITMNANENSQNNTFVKKFKRNLNILYRKFPWFIVGWTIVLIIIFEEYDNAYFSYSCQKSMFHWRIMTYHLNHIDTEHIVFNLIGFWIFGLYINAVYNDFINVLLYIIGIIVSGCTYYVDCYIKEQLSEIVGASGGISAIIGAGLVVSIKQMIDGSKELEDTKKKLKLVISNYSISFTIIISVIGIVSFDIVNYVLVSDSTTSYIAHFGGYISGIITALVIIIVYE